MDRKKTTKKKHNDYETNIRKFHTRLMVGKTYKYREMCELLEIPYYESGNSRKSEFKVIEKYIDYEKNGHSYTIKGYVENGIIEDMRGKNNLTDDLRLSILCVLFAHRNTPHSSYDEEKDLYTINMKPNKIFNELDIVNKNNYNLANYRPYAYSDEIGVDVDILRENISSLYSSNYTKVVDNLKALERLKLITYIKNTRLLKRTVDIKLNDEKDFMTNVDGEIEGNITETWHTATDKERALINVVKREILTKYNKKNERDIIYSKHKEDYYKELKEQLILKYNISAHYEVATIIFNDKVIIDFLNKFGGFGCEEIVRNNLSSNITKNSITQSKRRRSLAIKSDSDTKNIEIRKREDYIEESIKVHKSINRDYKNINISKEQEEEARKKHINKNDSRDIDMIKCIAKNSNSEYEFVCILKEMDLLKNEYKDLIKSFVW